MGIGVTMTISTSLLITTIFWFFATLPGSAGSPAASATIGMQRDSGRMFDKYGVLSMKEETARLDNLAAQLKREPHSKGYLVMYEGSDDRIRDLTTRVCRDIKHLIIRRAVNPKQVVAMMVSGGHREKFTVELWMWPLEASDELPRFQLGVDEKEVSIIRGSEVRRKCSERR
jgi:hypothetical protein